jgi:O-antigen/teichoic acid export membrane protein
MNTLKDKAVAGVKWSTVSQVGRQGTQLLTTIILARLLSPSDFGLLGMAMVVIGFIEIFKDLGTAAAVVQKSELSEEVLSSIFWVNVGFGILAATILFFGAPLGGLYFREPDVIAILKVLSLNFFISSLSILQQALLQRSLAFQVLAKVEIGAVVCGAIMGIGLAWYGFGVWSLVFQSLITVIITTVFLWLASSWRPRLIFHWGEVKSVSSFSLHLVGFNIFNYFARNLDYVLIGRYLGAQELGYYTLAYRILLFPIQNISAVIGRVMYPVLSTLQNDNKRFISAYLKVIGAIAFIAFPIMTGVFTLADPFVLTFFGDKWRTVIPLIMIFAPVGLLQSIGTTVGSIYQAKGRTDWMFRWGIGSGILVSLAFCAGLRWGIIGVAIAYSIISYILLYPSFAIPFQLIGLKFSYIVYFLFRPFLVSMLMMILLYLFKITRLFTLSKAVELTISLILGLFVYFVASWFINRKQVVELWDLIFYKEIVI